MYIEYGGIICIISVGTIILRSLIIVMNKGPQDPPLITGSLSELVLLCVIYCNTLL